VSSYGPSGMHLDSQLVNAYTTMNNCSQGLDLRSTSRHNEMAPVASSARVIPPDAECGPISLETDDKKETTLQILARMPPADKSECIDKWCKDQCEFTQSISPEVRSRKPTSNKTSVDKLIKRITHPFTQGDKKRLEAVNREIRNKPAKGTLTDIQHSEFAQGEYCLEFA